MRDICWFVAADAGYMAPYEGTIQIFLTSFCSFVPVTKRWIYLLNKSVNVQVCMCVCVRMCVSVYSEQLVCNFSRLRNRYFTSYSVKVRTALNFLVAAVIINNVCMY